MATPIVSPQAEQTQDHHDELQIDVWPDLWAVYSGTAAQLQAEGLIPEGFSWPERDNCLCWRDAKFQYELRRARPFGHKGPKRSWLAMDSWRMRVTVAERDHQWMTLRALQRKADALRAEFYRHTPAGAKAWDEAWGRYNAALSDEGFQAFKALVPGLSPGRGARVRTAAKQ